MGSESLKKSHFISELHRQLILELCHGQDYFLRLERLLMFICTHTRTVEVCKWLIRNKLTGKNLLVYWNETHSGSMLNVVAEINMYLEKEDQVRNVYAGRDII